MTVSLGSREGVLEGLFRNSVSSVIVENADVPAGDTSYKYAKNEVSSLSSVLAEQASNGWP